MAGAKIGQNRGKVYNGIYPMSGERMRAMVRNCVASHMGSKGYIWWREWLQRGGINTVEQQRELERKQLAEQLASGNCLPEGSGFANTCTQKMLDNADEKV